MALIPRMTKILAIFDPTTFPNARSVFPESALVTDTRSSGEDVPNATIVRPITIGDIFSLSDTEDAPETRKSAPLISINNPTTKRIIAMIIY